MGLESVLSLSLLVSWVVIMDDNERKDQFDKFDSIIKARKSQFTVS